MPNWNYATIYITGSKESIDKLVETGFDFQNIRPMPNELYEDGKGKNLGGCCWKKDDKTGTLDEWQVHCKTDKEREEMEEHYKEHLVDFATVCRWIDDYGANGWHEWATKNWGTKWNPYPESIDMERESDERVKVEMKTAWGLPIEIINFVIKKYNVKVSGETQNEDGMIKKEFALQ